MKKYQITISSHQNKNVTKTFYFATTLSKGYLMDILRPLTKYSISIEEAEKCPNIVLSLDGLLETFLMLKLKTKIAKNVLETKEGILGIFPNKPELTLNVWRGDNEKVRTYINNVYFSEISKIFPKVFEQDPKNKYPYFEGELYLDYKNEVWELRFIKSKLKVVYEEVILES